MKKRLISDGEDSETGESDLVPVIGDPLDTVHQFNPVAKRRLEHLLGNQLIQLLPCLDDAVSNPGKAGAD